MLYIVLWCRGLFETLAGILNLGNVAFITVEGGDSKCLIDSGNTIDSEEEKKCESEAEGAPLSLAACSFACDADGLRKALLTRRLLVGGQWIDVPLSRDQAIDNRDALSKVRWNWNWCWHCDSIHIILLFVQELYSRAFDWLVRKINISTAATGVTVSSSISVLDIFGFEVCCQILAEPLVSRHKSCIVVFVCCSISSSTRLNNSVLTMQMSIYSSASQRCAWVIEQR